MSGYGLLLTDHYPYSGPAAEPALSPEPLTMRRVAAPALGRRGLGAGGGVRVCGDAALGHGGPDDLALGDPAATRYFSPSFLDRAKDYERFLLIDTILSTIALVAVLAIYAQRGAVFGRESAAGRVGTGMLLAMLGFGIVWLTQLPFGVAALWWERRHDVPGRAT